MGQNMSRAQATSIKLTEVDRRANVTTTAQGHARPTAARDSRFTISKSWVYAIEHAVAMIQLLHRDGRVLRLQHFDRHRLVPSQEIKTPATMQNQRSHVFRVARKE
jgi:hypothetical protein